MGVTFTAELVDPAGFVVACCEAAAADRKRFGTYEDAREALRDFELCHMVNGEELRPLLPGCSVPEVCPEYEWSVFPVYDDPAPVVEATMVHAVAVLGALGYPVPDNNPADAFACGDLSGVADAAEFAGRVAVALALAPADAGMPAYEDTRPGGPRWHECGRRPGYLQEKLTELAELARWCAERGRRVQWS
jgi:hypothetical protein